MKNLSPSVPLPPPPTVSAPAIIPRTSTNRTNSYEQSEQQVHIDVEEDDTTTQQQLHPVI